MPARGGWSAFALAAVVACGGRAPAPAPPRPPDPAAIARQLDEDLARLGEVAHARLGDCPGLVAELEPLVARMQLHVDEANHAAADPEIAHALRVEMDRYAERASARAEPIAQDLATTYLGCKSEALFTLIKRIPHW